MELTDSGALTLAEAIIGLACDDITIWLKKRNKEGWDFEGDWIVPEIPTAVHKKLMRAETAKQKQKVLGEYYSHWKYDYYNKKKNYEDAKSFLLGGEDGWITFLTGVDGSYIYKKVMQKNGKLNTYIRRGAEKG